VNKDDVDRGCVVNYRLLTLECGRSLRCNQERCMAKRQVLPLLKPLCNRRSPFLVKANSE